MDQRYPQYCWEFHDRLWEALSGTTSEKRGAPSRTGGETILEMLWKPQMPWIVGFGLSQPYSRREFQETLWERFRGLSGIFPEILPESPSRTGGVAQWKIGGADLLSGPLNRLNATLSLLHPLDRYIGPRECDREAPISHPNTGGSPQPPRSKPLGGLNRAIVAL